MTTIPSVKLRERKKNEQNLRANKVEGGVTESVTKTDGEWTNLAIHAEKSRTDFQSHSQTMCISCPTTFLFIRKSTFTGQYVKRFHTHARECVYILIFFHFFIFRIQNMMVLLTFCVFLSFAVFSVISNDCLSFSCATGHHTTFRPKRIRLKQRPPYFYFQLIL